MALELPIITSGVSRLPDAEINLAALSGIVIPIAFLIESPIIMLLSASTALTRDWDSYKKIRLVMLVLGAFLTLLHILVAFTPLYDLITRQIIRVPEEIVEPARFAMTIVIPWSWAIAHRRFNQGLLIRSGLSKYVGLGTVIRVLTNLGVVITCVWLKTVRGIDMAAISLTLGVTSEALFIGFMARKTIKELKIAPAYSQVLTYKGFFIFYLPLVLTAFLDFASQPICSAAISRMDQPVQSLAVWPVIGGLSFMIRSLSIALSEVVIASIERPNAKLILGQFSLKVTIASTVVLLCFLLSPLGNFWFVSVTSLSLSLLPLAFAALWASLPSVIFTAARSYYQGALVHFRQTKYVSSGTALNLFVLCLALILGVNWHEFAGIEITMAGISLASIAQVVWLWRAYKKTIYLSAAQTPAVTP